MLNPTSALLNVTMRNYRLEKINFKGFHSVHATGLQITTTWPMQLIQQTNKQTHKLPFKQTTHILASNFKSLVVNYKGMVLCNTLYNMLDALSLTQNFSTLGSVSSSDSSIESNLRAIVDPRWRWGKCWTNGVHLCICQNLRRTNYISWKLGWC